MMSALSLAFAGCATIRKTGAAQDSRICLSEVNNSGCDRAYRIIHGKLRPLERPQVRFAIEKALIEEDSCWVLLRVTVPDQSIRKHERYNACVMLSTVDGILNFPELNLDNDSGLPEVDERSDSEETQEDTIVESLEIDARKGSPGYAYMSFRFCYHPSMEGNGAIISILPSLETKRYFFQHSPVELPVLWSYNPAMWKRAQQLPQFILLDKRPEYVLHGNDGNEKNMFK